MQDKDSLKYKCNLYLLLATAFMIPLHKMAMSPLIGLLFLSSIWNFKKPKSKDFLFLPIIGYFLVLVLGYFLSQNKAYALSELEYNVTFLLFPLIFIFSKLDFSSIAHKLLLYFIEGLLLSIGIAFVFSGYKFLNTGDINNFFYGEISPFHHTSYMAMYCSFGIAYIYYIGFHPSKSTFLTKKWMIISIVTLSVYILLLLSKTGVIITLVIHIFAISYWIFKHQKVKLGLISLSLILTVMVVTLALSKTMQNRFIEPFNAVMQDSATESSTSIRLISWDTSWQIFKDNTLWGVGTGDLNEAMRQKYLETGHNQLALKSLNSHNQFLTTATKSGIIGLFSLFMLLTIPVLFFRTISITTYCLLLPILIINFLTESVLQTQSGIIFSAFFITFFYALHLEKKQFKPNPV